MNGRLKITDGAGNSRTTDFHPADPITTSRYPYANTGESGKNQNRGTRMPPAQCSVSANGDIR
jgi:hypothetical protein